MSDPVSSSSYRPLECSAESNALEEVSSVGDPSAPAAPPAVHVIELEPVIVEGDAGARELVRKSRENTGLDPSACGEEKFEKQMACAEATLKALTSLATPGGLVDDVIETSVESLKCGYAREQYADCLKREEAREQRARECEEDGGIPLQSVRAHEIFCVLVRP